MSFLETILSALRDLSLRKFRSALAALGIIFAVAAVLSMISISDGARRDALEKIALLGVDNVIIRSVKPAREEVRQASGSQQQDFRNSYGILRRELEHVRTSYPMIKRSIGVKARRQPAYAPGALQSFECSVLATEPDYLTITRSQLKRGRFLHANDLEDQSMVCVVGADVARKIFGFTEPMGSLLRLGAHWYRVVGIIHNKANVRDAGGDDISNSVFIPISTALMRHGDSSVVQQEGSYEFSTVELHTIYLQLEDEAAVEPTARRLETFFKQTHKKKDYELTVPLQLMAQKAQTQRIFAIVMASIAGISLLIGGIGIMNIMLANVSDRRKEIGTRRALGASRSDIIYQFLIESATLTTLGGVVGLAVGWGLSKAVATYAGWPTYISPESIMLSLSVSSLSGLAFGLWPAHQASRVNPIESLRAD